ncbi:hypothetical protein FXN61_40265 [Lentzea sp. PSKA42]|uniref:Uncharacterized protein n=1 Tax=Lentzea indica TaxID=2604800 RepID=A0ABX1FVS3_9PSEU|nr:hypothetical protein [Lentzea indica]NKE62632.1 hypothetical protein [Lentzea indica]
MIDGRAQSGHGVSPVPAVEGVLEPVQQRRRETVQHPCPFRCVGGTLPQGLPLHAHSFVQQSQFVAAPGVRAQRLAQVAQPDGLARVTVRGLVDRRSQGLHGLAEISGTISPDQCDRQARQDVGAIHGADTGQGRPVRGHRLVEVVRGIEQLGVER